MMSRKGKCRGRKKRREGKQRRLRKGQRLVERVDLRRRGARPSTKRRDTSPGGPTGGGGVCVRGGEKVNGVNVCVRSPTVRILPGERGKCLWSVARASVCKAKPLCTRGTLDTTPGSGVSPLANWAGISGHLLQTGHLVNDCTTALDNKQFTITIFFRLRKGF